MVEGFALVSVATALFSPHQLCLGRMEANPIDIEAIEEVREVIGPRLLFNDVFDEQVVPCAGKGRDGAVEPVKEPLSFRRWEVSGAARSKSRICELIGGVVAEGNAERGSESGCQRGLACAGGAVEENDVAGRDAHRGVALDRSEMQLIISGLVRGGK